MAAWVATAPSGLAPSNLLLLPVAAHHAPPRHQRQQQQPRAQPELVTAVPPAANAAGTAAAPRLCTARVAHRRPGTARPAAGRELAQIALRKRPFAVAPRTAALPRVGAPHKPDRQRRSPPKPRVSPSGVGSRCASLWAWRADVLSSTFEKAREEAVRVRRRAALCEGRRAVAALSWERAIAMFADGLSALSPAGDQSLIAELCAGRASAEAAQEARDAARLDASRISMQAQMAHQLRRYEEAVGTWRDVLPLEIQDKGWSTQIRRELANAEAALAAQTNARVQVAERCDAAAAAMAVQHYGDAVAAYEAAQAHDEHVNDVLVEAEVLEGLDTAVTALENCNAARATARQQLDAARGFARVQSWEAAIEACWAGLEGEAVAGWSAGTMEAALSRQLRDLLRSYQTALEARNSARAEAAEVQRKSEALSADGDFAAAAAACQAALGLDTQDAAVTAGLQSAIHLAQASHQLKLGRACMPSQAWEQAITHFQRGLEHEPELSDHSVVSELRSGLSSCEVSRAARDAGRAFAATACQRGKIAAESRDYHAGKQSPLQLDCQGCF